MYVVPAYDTCMTWVDLNNTVTDVRRGSVRYLYDLNWPPITQSTMYVEPAYDTCMTWVDPNNTVNDVRLASVWYLYDLSWPQ